MAVNLAQKYSSVLDQVFTAGSYTDRYVNNEYKFDGVQTVNVYTATTVAPTAYSRSATGDRYGGNNELQNVVTSYTLTKDMSFKIAIDRGNYEQGALAEKAGAVLRAEMYEQVIPMIDTDRIATAATGATAVSQAITATADAYTDLLTAQAFLDEDKAPIEGRVIMLTPEFYNSVKSQIVTTMFASDYNTKLLTRGFVGELDGIPVVKVPTSYFPENTKAVVFHRRALLGVRQITSIRTLTNSELIDGTLLLGRFIFGSFVLNGKKKSVASIISGA